MKFEVWSEGFAATGQRQSRISRHVRSRGAGCAMVDANPEMRVYVYVYFEHLTYWGCRFFDNEVDARKSFG